MALTNLELETLWIDGWNELYDLMHGNESTPILTSQWIKTPLSEAEKLIQDRAYASEKVSFEEVWWNGKKAIQLHFAEITP